MQVITQAQQNKRRNQFILDLKKRVKRKGDYIFRKVENLTGDGDYLEGKDSGEPKGGY